MSSRPKQAALTTPPVDCCNPAAEEEAAEERLEGRRESTAASPPILQHKVALSAIQTAADHRTENPPPPSRAVRDDVKIEPTAKTVGGMVIEIGGGEGRSILHVESKGDDKCDSGSTQVAPPR